MSDLVELSELPPAYPSAFRAEPGSCDLVVVMSPLDRFALTKYPFGRNVLLLADAGVAYYAPQADRASAAVMAFSRARSFERTLFLGNSKSAYGAMLWSRLASLAAPPARSVASPSARRPRSGRRTPTSPSRATVC